MCHFESTAQELGLRGKWIIEESLTHGPNSLGEYLVSWNIQTSGN